MAQEINTHIRNVTNLCLLIVVGEVVVIHRPKVEMKLV